MRRLLRNMRITLECRPEDCWVGAYWERKQVRYRTGEGIVTAELHVWICLAPCFPLHVIHTTGLRWVPALDEHRQSWGVGLHPPREAIPGTRWSWVTRRSR